MMNCSYLFLLKYGLWAKVKKPVWIDSQKVMGDDAGIEARNSTGKRPEGGTISNKNDISFPGSPVLCTGSFQVEV
jgi:hypothetical protein